MSRELSILYRGPLSSCNYDCAYCPFAKQRDSAAELKEDQRALERFIGWVETRADIRISVLFTPWGEALIRRWYREAIVRLSQTPHVPKVAIQTNLSCPLDWLSDSDLSAVGLWCTFHPSQTTRSEFLAQCRLLDQLGVRYSVGTVGLKPDFDEIKRLRQELQPDVYLWINAYKRETGYYSDSDVRTLEQIDPLFHLNTKYHSSLGRSCRCGTSVISVDGEGNVRRCHFIAEVLGNIYEPDFDRILYDRPCTNQTCGCHIGYVHLDHLKLYNVYGKGVLERIPEQVELC